MVVFPVLDTGTAIVAALATGAVAVLFAPAALPLTLGVPVEIAHTQPASPVVLVVDIDAGSGLGAVGSGERVIGALVVCSADGTGAGCGAGATVVLVVVVVVVVVGVLAAGP